MINRFIKIKKLKEDDKNLSEDESIVMRKFFGDNQSTTITEKYNQKVFSTFSNLSNYLEKKFDDFVKEKPNNKLIFKAAKIIIVVFITALLIACFVAGEYETLLFGFFLVLFNSLILFFHVFGLD